MNTVRKALELVEPFLATERYWSKIMTYEKHTYFEAGPVYEDGSQDCPVYSGIVRWDGSVFESHRRI